MEPIYSATTHLPVIISIKIYDVVLDDNNNTHCPVEINGTSYKLKISKDGFWWGDGLSDEICDYVGGIIEKKLF